MEDSRDSWPFGTNLPMFTPEDYLFHPTLCSCPESPVVCFSHPPESPPPHACVPEGWDFMDDCPPNEQQLARETKPEPQLGEHDTCSKYMRTTTSRKATKIMHTPIHTSTNSPQDFCWVHYVSQGPGPIPFPKSPPPSPNAASLVDSIFERAPTEWGGDMKSQEDLQGMKTAFLLGYDASFREQTPPDIQLRPLGDETLIPAHKCVLATRSKILGMSDLDGSCGRDGIVRLPSCGRDGIVRLPESREELEPLLEFIYTGSLPEEKMRKNIVTLFRAAYKYEIWYLWELCAHRGLSYLTSSNDLEVLYLAYCCRHRALLEAALKLIVEDAQRRICCSEFINFGYKYPHMIKLVRMAFVVCRKPEELLESDQLWEN